jgi:hypothetical protein
MIDIIVGVFVSRGASKQRIASLSSYVLDSETKFPGRCAICLGDWEAMEEIRSLHCCHAFHTECVDPWLERRNLCPICKADAC